MIEEQTRQMGRLIDDLLDVSRITTGKIRLELTCFDVAEVLAETVQSYRDTLEANGLRLISNCQTGSYSSMATKPGSRR